MTKVEYFNEIAQCIMTVEFDTLAHAEEYSESLVDDKITSKNSISYFMVHKKGTK